MKPLIVYKASAGSGKTFTLATEYIKLLVNNPTSYRNILAVTFTNKATEEMKMRILSQLYGIWKNLESSKPYMEKIKEELGVSENIISKNAGIALTLLLHNYNYFKVETIDSFFQSVLRNLARELDLTPNLRIELNDYQVEEQAVDNIIENLNTSSIALTWILNYIKKNISDDKTWNVITPIKNFGKTIFKDFYKENSERLNLCLSQPDFLDNYIKKIDAVKDKAKDNMVHISETFFDCVDSAGISPDAFKGGSRGIQSYFNKLRSDDFSDATCMNKTLANCLESQENWVTKSSPQKMEIIALVNDCLYDLLQHAENVRSKQWCLYHSAIVTTQHLSQLRLLNDIEKKVHKLNEDSNRFLLSDTQQLLHSLIQENDSPFIFEKIGTRLEHIMIDEFQDTSTVQWKNFKILLQECMSHENTENLIVGDVKQSIYRWRSGDWRLLNDIEKQFPVSDKQLDIRNLDTNYRSAQRIIDFNNAFFTIASNHEYQKQKELNGSESEQLQKAYADVVQKIPEGRDNQGMVQVTLLNNEDYEQQTLTCILETINTLLEKGIKPNKIAILVRKNLNIPIIADFLIENLKDVNIVSDEAFHLDASTAVTLIIDALHYITHPLDMLAKARMVKVYQRQILKNDLCDNDLFINDNKDEINKYLPEEYIKNIKVLAKMSLSDLVEHIYAIFDIKKLNQQSAYICAFFDQINSFVNDNYTDIDAFLEEWEDSIHNKTIQSDEINGIRLITIHKSKGLEFDNVIIPFCDWTLENRDILWCTPSKEDTPFNELPIIPIDYSNKSMTGTIYEKDYLHENLQSTVDNLNLLYVAFTRASKSLFVYGKKDVKSNSRSIIIQDCMQELKEKLEDANIDEEEEYITFRYGDMNSLSTNEENKDKNDLNVFKQKTKTELISVDTFEKKVEFRQSNKSKDFIGLTDDEDEKALKQQSYIKTGNILHQLFSSIHTTDDIEPTLKEFQQEGILYDDDITKEKLLSLIRKRLSDNRIKEWFSPKWKVFNECSILSVDQRNGEMVEHRPDRVMTDGKEMIVIDFKFGRPRDEYKEQVNGYIQLLKDMGYNNVHGYLWFVYTNTITEIR